MKSKFMGLYTEECEQAKYNLCGKLSGFLQIKLSVEIFIAQRLILK